MAYTTIDDPSAHFQTKIYSGDGNDDRNITFDGNSDLAADWLWFKRRNQDVNHILFDSTRGVTKRFHSNNSNVEATEANFLQAFQSDGFQVGTDADINASGGTYVGWGWKANGGTTTTNDASSTSVGSIDSVYQANTTAGFSIVTYTGTGSTATVAHGLGVVPDMLIFKKRNATDNWYVYHKQLTNDYYLVLDTTGAQNNDVNIWNDTDPTSTVFSIANAGVHADGKTMICYAFAEKKGYSRFGTYTGNGATDGTFIFTGFSPAWVLTKRTSGSEAWMLSDNKRPGSNAIDEIIEPNDSAAEGASTTIDHYSNGFKFRHENSNVNGERYIYMAFAASPFTSSKGVPTTAR